MLAAFKNFTRAGQTWSHNIRMWAQAFKAWVILAFVVLFVLLNVMNFFALSTPEHREDYYVLWRVVPLEKISNSLETEGAGSFANFIHRFFFKDVKIAGKQVSLNAARFYLNESRVGVRFKRFALVSSVLSVSLAALLVGFLMYFMVKAGGRISRDSHVRGSETDTIQSLKHQLIEADLASWLTLGGVPLVKGTECQHVAISGTIGSGKTVGVSEVLSQIRRRGERAIVYDRKGAYIERFYRPGKDIILNPFDKRSPAWSLWAECQEPMDFDTIAASLMPLSSSKNDDNGPFWVKAARTLFSVVANRMKDQPDRSMSKLLKALFTEDMEKVQSLVKGTEAESLTSDEVKKMALSVKSILTTYTKCLKYVYEDDHPFSIRQWVTEGHSDGAWIFISSRSRYHETLRPLLTTWLDIAVNAILELERNTGRTVFVFLDELPTLQELPSLPEAMALGREYGLSVWLTFQNLAQMNKVFGKEGTEDLLDLCNTYFFLRANSDDTAKKLSSILGEAEVREKNENISYGSNEIRDGVSLSPQDKTEAVVMPSEIQKLEDLCGYLKLPGGWPIVKLALTWRLYEKVASEFEQRKIRADLLESVFEEEKSEDVGAGFKEEKQRTPASMQVKKSRKNSEKEQRKKTDLEKNSSEQKEPDLKQDRENEVAEQIGFEL